MKRKRIRYFLALLIIVIIFCVLIPAQVFSLSESGAIKKYPSSTTGNIIYEQQYEGKKVMVTAGNPYNDIYVVKSYFGFLYRVIVRQQISSPDPSVPLLRTWGGRLNKNNLYDTIIAVKPLDSAIVKVIVSNEEYEEEYSNNIGDIIANSTFFEVLTIKDGFAAYIDELDPHLVGGYIFRGLNAHGEIVAILR